MPGFSGATSSAWLLAGTGSQEALHQVGPFAYFDERPMKPAGDNRAFAPRPGLRRRATQGLQFAVHEPGTSIAGPTINKNRTKWITKACRMEGALVRLKDQNGADQGRGGHARPYGGRRFIVWLVNCGPPWGTIEPDVRQVVGVNQG